MNCSRFTEPDTWHGGYYELAIELGPRSESRLRSALTRLWSHPHLEGCYASRELDPNAQPHIAPVLTAEPGHLYGLATLPNGVAVACGTCVVREEDGPDWLDLYLPLGGLGLAYPVGAYPFGAEPTAPSWQPELDAWFRAIGVFVFQAVPFALGVIGFEASGSVYSHDLSATGIPSKCGVALLWPTTSGLLFHPPNVS